MFLDGFRDYFDIRNGNRIDDLSSHDPFAIFAFALLCSMVFLAVFMITCTARRSAHDAWDSVALPSGPHYRRPNRYNDLEAGLVRESEVSLARRSEGIIAQRQEAPISRPSFVQHYETSTCSKDRLSTEPLLGPSGISSSEVSLPEYPAPSVSRPSSRTLFPRIRGMSLTSKPEIVGVAI